MSQFTKVWRLFHQCTDGHYCNFCNFIVTVIIVTFLPQSSLATSLLTPPESMDGMKETRRVKSLQL